MENSSQMHLRKHLSWLKLTINLMLFLILQKKENIKIWGAACHNMGLKNHETLTGMSVPSFPVNIVQFSHANNPQSKDAGQTQN